MGGFDAFSSLLVVLVSAQPTSALTCYRDFDFVTIFPFCYQPPFSFSSLPTPVLTAHVNLLLIGFSCVLPLMR